ncbi:serine/threonine-protein phosphatase 6 regulatory ankyrin repeat subunit A-like [Acropora millepora]|uniref:serine/threonine-protein phosphatase 6 regulatory ankyrin repeat subunit A-like n=1 Tax=Acropora millepora TaxID=45264 RepID=UPI001CF20D14|nr:serine/threonine-protein phosphatase 6 regulatory ankyrin repeat subunit A-like [Acropora millepora]
MHAAAQIGSRPIIDKLFSLGLDIGPRNSSGPTPLMIAATNGNVLIRRASDLTLKYQDGWSALHKTAKGGSDVILAKLLSLIEADVDTRYIYNYGSTPVKVAAANGKFNASCFLSYFFVERGSDLTLKNNDEWNVLHKAAKGGSKAAVS